MHKRKAAVSRGILQTGPRNLAKFTTENCGPYLIDELRVIMRPC